jgi:maltose phosphorylase
VGLASTLHHERDEVGHAAQTASEGAAAEGYDALLAEHVAAWEGIWATGDIEIGGDDAAQQGIRFNIFHLNQTYRGDDERLNIGPKGFTGEKYGGASYWDTEAYCLPFFLATHPVNVPKQLLAYRYAHLDRAIENAEKLGFSNGAALYPMVTMNGEECHNEWEITFEEIHRNGAMSYAIFNYVRYTGDWDYLAEKGFPVLLGVARFWAQRVNWSAARESWVMLGVTGPNEYENNVNNNWYTNYLAAWCMRYAADVADELREHRPDAWSEFVSNWAFRPEEEVADWRSKAAGMYLPKLEGTPIWLQQDGFMDKEQQLVADLDPHQRPINQHWSWDRILRSVFIKQADVLQGMYFFEDDFDAETHAANFDFYEPRTVHESSLSPCVHVVLASKLNRPEKAYELYLRTARLDLDDYNAEAYQGLHITSMAGTWLSVVEGFGGFRVRDGIPHFRGQLPKGWTHFQFMIQFRERLLEVIVTPEGTEVRLKKGEQLEVKVDGEVKWLHPAA